MIFFNIKRLGFIVWILFVALNGKAQNPTESDSIDDQAIYKEIFLDELYISNQKLSSEEIEALKQFLILKRRVYRTYPYAKTASEKLEILNENLSKLKSKREKKKFLKITEKYLENEFEEKLKNLSQKDGQILVKLIERQTGQTTYDLVKNLKSGWSAYWYEKIARIYNIDLKTKFQPYSVEEDFWIEKILLEGFKLNILIEQRPKHSIDYLRLENLWKDSILKKISD